MCFVNRHCVKFLLPLLAATAVQADVTLTQLANNGVRISDGETRVLIDGMVVESYSVYAGLPAAAAADFESLSGPFGDVDLVLVSHRHHDHNQPAFACDFMRSSVHSELYGASQVVDLMREKCRDFVTGTDRVRVIEPLPGQPVRFERGGARVTAFALSHGKRKFARVQNLAYRVELGGVRLLHVGDAAMDRAAFEAAGLDGVEADVVVIPVWFFRPGPGAAVIEAYLDAPLMIAAQVPPGEMAEARAYLAENFPAVRLLDPMETIRYEAPSAP